MVIDAKRTGPMATTPRINISPVTLTTNATMNEDDPLTSYHKRTKRYLAAVASGANTLPFGCSDFYPSPTVLTGQYEQDDDYVEDQEADLEELEVQDSRKKTPRPSKNSLKRFFSETSSCFITYVLRLT